MNFGDSIKGIPMLNKKMPVGRTLTNKVKVLKREFNLVAKNDGGASLEAYKYELVEVEKPAKKTKTCGEGAGAEESKGEEETKEDVETEGLKLVKKAYLKMSGKVYKIIQAFMMASFTSLSLTELKASCNGSFSPHAFDKWDLGTHKYYKIIEKTNSGRYNLRTEIINILDLM